MDAFREERILVVDDEKHIREILAASLNDDGYLVETAESGEVALDKMEKFSPHVTLLDIWMPGIDGIEVLNLARKKFSTDFIVMSGHGTIETAVQATKLGAWDFIEKPVSMDKVSILLKNILTFQKEKKEKRSLLNRLRQNIAIVGVSDKIKAIKQLVAKIAASNSWIYISGETGVGKELVAQNLHYMSPRAGESFVNFKCSQNALDLIEGELFGYEQGALIGGSEERRGQFDLAHRGTLLLKDIEKLPLHAQDKLLRYLQSGKFQRVGGTKNIEVDVRVIATSTADIKLEVEKKNFRLELYERLTVVPIEIMPLRNRIEDIDSLIFHFSQKCSSTSGYSLKIFSPQALEFMKKYNWPGNVRELKNFVERVYILTPEETIDVHDLKFAGLMAGDSDLSDFTSIGNFREARSMFEKEFIIKKINENNGNISRTAEAIGLERSYLHRKIKAFGIEFDEGSI